MSFCALPAEILDQIILETIPESFENFALTCKRVYDAGAGFREKHNNLRRRYHHFWYDEEDDEVPREPGRPCLSSIELLLQIAEEPLIARYIVTAAFQNDSRSLKPDNEILDRAKASSNFLLLLEESPYLQTIGAEPNLVLEYLVTKNLFSGTYVKLATVLLLTLLPNVTELALPSGWIDVDSSNSRALNITALLDDIVQRANDPLDASASLSNLTSIRHTIERCYGDRGKLCAYTPFLSIKTVKSFTAGGCRAVDDSYTGALFPNPSYESLGVGLEVVELPGFCVESSELQKFLSRLPRLRSFKMSYEFNWHARGRGVDTNGIISTIAGQVGGALEVLSYSIYATSTRCASIVESMAGFTKLKELELGMEALIIHDNSWEVRDSWEVKGGAYSGPRLGDLIPPSVEKLCLLVENARFANQDLDYISSAATENKGKLLNLKEIIVRIRVYNSVEETDASSSDESEVNGYFSLEQNDCEANDYLDSEWRKNLAALAPSANISVVGVNRYMAPFMLDLCKKYAAEFKR